MTNISDFMNALQNYPALPKNMAIGNMIITADGQTTDIRNHIAKTPEEKRELSDNAHTKRQRVLVHANADGSETTVFVSKLDRKDAMRKTRFYDNPFYPLIGNALMHEMEDHVMQHANAQAEGWEMEEAGRSSMDKIRNGKGGRKAATMVNREIIKYNVITRYADGSRSQAVLTEPVDVTYEFVYHIGSNNKRMRFNQLGFKGLNQSPKSRFTKFRIKDPFGHDMTFENGRLSIDITGLDLVDHQPDALDKELAAPTFDPALMDQPIMAYANQASPAAPRTQDGSVYDSYRHQITDIEVRNVPTSGTVYLSPEPAYAAPIHYAPVAHAPVAHAPMAAYEQPAEQAIAYAPVAAQPVYAAPYADAAPVNYAPAMTPPAALAPQAMHAQEASEPAYVPVQELPQSVHVATIEQAVQQETPKLALQPQGLAPHYDAPSDHPYENRSDLPMEKNHDIRPQHAYAPLHARKPDAADDVMKAASEIVANGMNERISPRAERDPNYPF